LTVFCIAFYFLFSPSSASPARCCVLLPGHECDSEQSPDPTQDSYVCGVHSVSSLCKMYFRELPNPLLSDRLYEQLSVSTRHCLSFTSSLGLLPWPVTYTYVCTPVLVFILFQLGFS